MRCCSPPLQKGHKLLKMESAQPFVNSVLMDVSRRVGQGGGLPTGTPGRGGKDVSSSSNLADSRLLVPGAELGWFSFEADPCDDTDGARCGQTGQVTTGTTDNTDGARCRQYGRRYNSWFHLAETPSEVIPPYRYMPLCCPTTYAIIHHPLTHPPSPWYPPLPTPLTLIPPYPPSLTLILRYPPPYHLDTP